MARPAGFEPATSASAGQRSIHLSYGRWFSNGGERGIRTPGTFYRTHDFQSCTFSHSVISPPEAADTRRAKLEPCPRIFLSPGEEGRARLRWLRPTPDVTKSSAHSAVQIWRRERDSNPRGFRLTVFKTAAFDRSAISPRAGPRGLARGAPSWLHAGRPHATLSIPNDIGSRWESLARPTEFFNICSSLRQEERRARRRVRAAPRPHGASAAVGSAGFVAGPVRGVNPGPCCAPHGAWPLAGSEGALRRSSHGGRE